MNETHGPETDRWILAQRPAKADADPWRPHAYFVEAERSQNGLVEDVLTLLLTNRECPFRCLMCDLWKHTTDQRVPDGAIAAQVEWAFGQLGSERLRSVRHVKLYNAGNFFDAQAIPSADLPRLAELLNPFETVIIECHPLLVGKRCLAFQERLRPRLQVAMGLETIHPNVLPRLNKRMTLADFERAARFLGEHELAVRAFILLRPPFLNEDEGVVWAKRSIEYAFDQGVECCAVIPTRAGNGAMDRLQEQGLFSPPCLESLEATLEFGVGLKRGRVFADLWDIEKFFRCARCGPERARRLLAVNLSQNILPDVLCDCRS
jgi:archaeosine synthase beta-subunit